jgi:prolipoprotein diacylglyceryltransferase
MLQVIWRIPILKSQFPDGVPIYGFGLMLFFAFIICTWLGGRRGEREGIKKETIQDLALWIFLGGLLGARITYLMQENPGLLREKPLEFLMKLPKIWDGGIILYGSVVGAVLGYLAAYFFVFRKQGLSTLRFADAAAPCIAIGLCLGRIGCFLNGCCFGQVACNECAVCAVSFPMSAPSREYLVDNGSQTAAGFTIDLHDSPRYKLTADSLDELAGDGVPPQVLAQLKKLKDREFASEGRYQEELEKALDKSEAQEWRRQLLHRAGSGAKVGLVDPTSAVGRAGLESGAIITRINGRPIHDNSDLARALSGREWPRGQWRLAMTYLPKVGADPQTLDVVPRTLGLYPTQLYEVVSMALLLLVLLAYEPFRRNPGQVIAVLMVGYGIHRSLNEMLRDDPRPVSLELLGSAVLVVAGIVLWTVLSRMAPAGPVKPVGDAAKREAVPVPG